MKKLFFVAALAVVAVGGAFTVNAQYLQGESNPISCVRTTSPTCAAQLGLPANTPIYESPNSQPGDPQVGTLADYFYTGE